MLERLAQMDGFSGTTADLNETLRVLNGAAHGVKISPKDAAAALKSGMQLLDELHRLGSIE
jgi:hypothetical protein